MKIKYLIQSSENANLEVDVAAKRYGTVGEHLVYSILETYAYSIRARQTQSNENLNEAIKNFFVTCMDESVLTRNLLAKHQQLGDFDFTGEGITQRLASQFVLDDPQSAISTDQRINVRNLTAEEIMRRARLLHLKEYFQNAAKDAEGIKLFDDIFNPLAEQTALFFFVVNYFREILPEGCDDYGLQLAVKLGQSAIISNFILSMMSNYQEIPKMLTYLTRGPQADWQYYRYQDANSVSRFLRHFGLLSERRPPYFQREFQDFILSLSADERAEVDPSCRRRF